MNENSSQKLTLATDIIKLYQNITISEYAKTQQSMYNIKSDIEYINSRVNILENSLFNYNKQM